MIMITGGGGFLGLNIARSLAKRGQHVLLVQRHAVPCHPLLAPYWDTHVNQAIGNVLDRRFLFGLVQQYPIDSVIHGAFDTAAVVNPERIKSDLPRLVHVELEGSRNLLEMTRIAGLRRLTFISSVDSYRGWPGECEVWREDAYLPPVSFSPIGNCKRAVEQLGFLYSKTYNLGFVSLRVGRVYGPGASNTQPIRTMIEGSAAGRPVDLSNIPGSARAHTVYAEDVGEATALIHLAQSLKHYIYNISDGTNPTMIEIARTIRDLIPGAEIKLGPAAEERPVHTGVDLKRIQEEFGFVFRDLRKGIMEYISWLVSSRQSSVLSKNGVKNKIMSCGEQSGNDAMLAFSRGEFARRHRKIREIMRLRRIDCLIITGNTGGNQSSAADIRYITGLAGSATEGTYILFPLTGEPVYLAPSSFVADRMGKRCPIPVAPVAFRKGMRIRDYGSDLVNRIKALGLERGTIGIVTMRVMPAETYVNLRESLPEADFVSAGDALLQCRLIKSPEELEFVRKAGECADKGMQAIVEAARPGVTEAELTARCDYAMIRAGADRGPFILLASGPWEHFQGAIGDASHSQRELRKGDIILTELSPSYGGYYAQLCAPISIGGNPPHSFTELLEIDKEIYRLALQELLPGNTVGAIEAGIFDFARTRGDFRRAWALQSTELAEAFFKVDTEIKEGMSYVIHPWTEFSSGQGLQGHTIGNTVIITGKEPEQISKLPLDLVIV